MLLLSQWFFRSSVVLLSVVQMDVALVLWLMCTRHSVDRETAWTASVRQQPMHREFTNHMR